MRGIIQLSALLVLLGLTLPAQAQYPYPAYPAYGWPQPQAPGYAGGYGGYPQTGYSGGYQVVGIVTAPAAPAPAAPAPAAPAPAPAVRAPSPAPKRRGLIKAPPVTLTTATMPAATALASAEPVPTTKAPPLDSSTIGNAIPLSASQPGSSAMLSHETPVSGQVVHVGTDPVLGGAPIGGAVGGDGGCHVFAIGGISLLHAMPASRDAFRVLRSNTNTAGASSTSTNTIHTEKFNNSVEVSPLGWLGVVWDGCGVRGRYWYFRETADRSVVNNDLTGSQGIASILGGPFAIVSSSSGGGFVPGPTGGGALLAGVGPDYFTTSSDLTLQSGDLDVFVMGETGNWTLLGGAGIRYANLRQTYDVVRTNPGGFSAGTGFTYLTDSETSEAKHTFDGLGPTLAGEFTRRLGDSNLAIYGLGRGSMLIGQHRLSVFKSQVLEANPGGGPFRSSSFVSDSTSVNDIVPVGELEIGAQYTHDVGNARVLLRAGFQAQKWWDAGTAVSASGDLDFYGGSFLMGLLY